jgi:NAD(P)-dependent dehydrogenase (short-subunit alcohol dehydrogenase family)
MRSDEVLLITGATGKLGRSMLRGFSQLGYVVAFTTRAAEAAQPLREQCLSWGARAARVFKLDLTAEDGASRVTRSLEARGLVPPVLINNARSMDTIRPNADGMMPLAHWHGEFELGVVVAYDLTMGCTRLKRAPRSVINVASIYGVTAANRGLYEQPDFESPINYGVVKAELIHLTKRSAARRAGHAHLDRGPRGFARGRGGRPHRARGRAARDLIGQVDAVLLARDDAERHVEMAVPLLRSGLPVYVDKPVALSQADLEALYAATQYEGQLFSCSALRYSPSIRLDEASRARIGDVRHVEGVAPKFWRTYAVHLVDPLLASLGLYGAPCEVRASRGDAHVTHLRFPSATATLTCTGGLPGELKLRNYGERGYVNRPFTDTFVSFRAALAMFVDGVRRGVALTTREELTSVVGILEGGLRAE